MMMNNNSKRTDNEVYDLIALALVARRAHECRTRAVDTVTVHSGIHTQFGYNSATVNVEGVTVKFFRARHHSPCRGKCYYEVTEPFGSKGGIEIDASDYWIDVTY